MFMHFFSLLASVSSYQSISFFLPTTISQLAVMCAFKHATNELLRSFNEQCVHLMIIFWRLRNAHKLHAIKSYEMILLVVINGQIHEFFVYVAGKKGSFAIKQYA